MSDELYALVESYSDLGEHRTGTEVDAATVAWFAGELEKRGGQVELHDYTFDRYNASWSVTANGVEIPSLPLFYEGAGRVAGATPTVGSIDAFAAIMGRPDHDPFVETARKDGTGVALLATTGTLGGALAVPNRAPKKPHEVPVLLVEGAAKQRITEDQISVDIDAYVEEGRSANVLARFGGDDDDPLIVATPLSGWFKCAGERGTGIAVTLEIAKRLADRSPVLVVGTTGHELIDLGLQRLLGSQTFTPRAVLHVGACIAAMDAPGILSARRRCTASVGPESQAALVSALDAIDLVPTSVPREDATDPSRWMGEAQEWCTLGAPLVSVTGYYPFFHTPQDVPSAATTPGLLTRTADALTEAAVLLSK
jgi:hypothetical protein